MTSHDELRKTRVTRREMVRRLGASAGALLSSGLWPGTLNAADPGEGAFRFLVVNDTHYMSPQCGDWLASVFNQMRSHQDVAFCLMAGDLTEHGKRNELAAARDVFRILGKPVFVVIGNHDYETARSRFHYEQLFPRRLNYSFRHRGWQFVGLDTSEGQNFEHTRIQAATFQWLRDRLRLLNPEKPTVVFTHFPLGAGVTYRPLNADALLDCFRPFNLQAVFCGHFHGFTERRQGAASVTTNRCCALKRANHDKTTEKGYFLCTASRGRIERQFVQVQMPPA